MAGIAEQPPEACALQTPRCHARQKDSTSDDKQAFCVSHGSHALLRPFGWTANIPGRARITGKPAQVCMYVDAVHALTPVPVDTVGLWSLLARCPAGFAAWAQYLRDELIMLIQAFQISQHQLQCSLTHNVAVLGQSKVTCQI